MTGFARRGFEKMIKRAYGHAYVSTAGGAAFPGTTAWRDLPGTFSAGELLCFTHSAGVLTYTGPGEVVLVSAGGSMACGATVANGSLGISVNDGNPAAGCYIDYVYWYINQYRYYGVPPCIPIEVANGDTLQVKARDNGGGSDVLNIQVGTSLTVIGLG